MGVLLEDTTLKEFIQDHIQNSGNCTFHIITTEDIAELTDIMFEPFKFVGV